MAVFGEETVPLNIFQGVTAEAYHRKSDLNIACLNLVKTGPEELTIREDLAMLQTRAFALASIPVATQPTPIHTGQTSITGVFTATGTNGTDTPSLITCYSVDGVNTNSVNWLNFNASVATSYIQTIANNRQIVAFCQYKDRYYASNGVDKVFQVSGFSSAIPPLTVTDLLTTTAGITNLIAHKNRIFGFTRNRIYFTNLPAIGGYPETWDANLNFIDMPVIDRDCTIYQALVYRDKIYLFTDRGLFYFQANGDPTNWIVQLVSPNFPVFSKESACIAKNTIYLTDQEDVYSFDGTNFRSVSGGVKQLFYNTNRGFSIMAVYAFENGIVLNRNEFNNVAGNYSGITYTQIYYYDTQIWTTLTAETSNGAGTNNGSFGLVKAGTNFAPYRGFQTTSFLTYISTGPTIVTLAFRKGEWKGDCFGIDHVGTTRTPKQWKVIGPAFVSKKHEYTKLKGFYLFGKFNMDYATISNVSMQGGAYENAVPAQPKPIFSASMSPFNSIIRIPASADVTALGGSHFVNSQVTIYLKGDAANDITTNALNNHEPPVIITGVEAIVNTNNRSATELRNT